MFGSAFTQLLCNMVFDEQGYPPFFNKCFLSGHGMILENGHEKHEHWGRRLMGHELDNDNETESKNCTEPGMLHHWRKLLSLFLMSWSSIGRLWP